VVVLNAYDPSAMGGQIATAANASFSGRHAFARCRFQLWRKTAPRIRSE
jgi:hypothetical protein